MNQLIKIPKVHISQSLLPESKSILIRVLFITAFLNRSTTLTKINFNEDIKVMITALKQLGKTIYYTPSQLTIHNTNIHTTLANTIQLKNSGITARIMCVFAMLLGKKNLTLIGTKQLYKRPFKETIKICSKLLRNNPICFLKHRNQLPIKVIHTPQLKLPKILHITCKYSSQTLTALLIILPLIIKKKLTIKIKQVVSVPYIKLVTTLLKKFNINIIYNSNIVIYPGKYKLKTPITKLIEKDNSAVPYYIFNRLDKACRLQISSKTLTSTQKEIKIIKILNSLGFKLTPHAPTHLKCYRHTPNVKYLTVNCSEIIDTAMLLPTLIINNVKKIKLYNIYNWNFKECKRITALNKELKKLGLKTKKGNNWIKIHCYKLRNNAIIDTYKDHRMVLSMFQYSNKCNIVINNPNNIKKTFPNFLKQCLTS
ncbi:hypothetical protein JSR02_00585 [Candidatus Vidania fulgoroideae]|uniref:3-phosphoshikimate 1-carboxyvinyltransferase n=1 Tax=Candidatus Vidania fulgoroideorum TaxID=881286 RepID=A0A974X720_9PROT|nr:hypothetical protein JSR02_00585 [Candidatus Vidania fulgoroideae]